MEIIFYYVTDRKTYEHYYFSTDRDRVYAKLAEMKAENPDLDIAVSYKWRHL